MCGIAAIMHRGKQGEIGGELTSMLQALRHRGPDSTGFAFYGQPARGQYIMRFKAAEQEDLKTGFRIHQQIKERRAAVDARLKELGVEVVTRGAATEYAFRYTLKYEGDLHHMADYIEDVEGAEILSIGESLELVKDLGDAREVSRQYDLGRFTGSHAIGHSRMATESDVDIRSAHPYWAYPFNDVAVVHNGQLTNYWNGRRDLEHQGHRFMSNCDSELIAVYLADKMNHGYSLEDAMRESLDRLDGVFTYVVATSDQIGMAKDVMAAKPMVLYEGEDCVVLASEEVAIRSIFNDEIDTWDPYEGEVRVWKK